MTIGEEIHMQLYHVYGDDIYKDNFLDYLDTIPAMFRMYKFEQAVHPDFKKFLDGIPRLINVMGQGVIT